MLLIKKCFDLYIKSSFHLGICVIALYLVSIFKQQVSINHLLIIFIFSATVVVYNFIKFGYKLSFYFKTNDYGFKIIKFFSFLCAFFLIYTSFFLKFETLIFSCFLFLICVLYVFPIGYLKSNFRSLSKVKVFLVALCWSGSTVLLPVFEDGLSNFYFTSIYFLQIFVLVLIYTIPFEIRDLQNDSIELQTIPQIFGIKNSKKICYLLIIIFLFLSIINSGIESGFYSDLILSFVLVFILYITKKNQTKYFSSFWVEAVPLYWFLVCYFLK